MNLTNNRLPTRLSTHLPKGPKGRVRSTLAYVRDAYGVLERWSKEFGDPFLINALNGPIVVTGMSDLIGEIFSADPANYEIFARAATEPILGSGSMLMLLKEEHRRERKLVMPMFHGQRMKSYAESIKESAIRSFDARVSGGIVAVHDITTEISLDVIVRVLIGADDETAAQELVRQSGEVMKRTLPLFFFTSRTHFSFLGLSPWDRLVKARKNLREAVLAEIEKRKNSLEGREDILSLMMGARYEDGSSMSPEHLLDEMGTFLFAGHETSAVALAWAVYYLLTNPECLERLLGELESIDTEDPAAMSKLPWLKAIVNESLRLNPIIPDVLRKLKVPMNLGEYRLPAGCAVAPAVFLAHRNEDVFPNPDRFDPSRFIDQSYASTEYLPFGGGVRRCAGAAFALYEMAIVLGTLFSRYELKLHEPKPVTPKRRNVTIGPSTGIRVEIKRK